MLAFSSQMLHIKGIVPESVQTVSFIAVTGRVVFRSESISADGMFLQQVPKGVYLVKMMAK